MATRRDETCQDLTVHTTTGLVCAQAWLDVLDWIGVVCRLLNQLARPRIPRYFGISGQCAAFDNYFDEK